MSVISMKQLLEAGVHFGHQTRRWNPKMAEYIFTERNGIYIIDLQKTVKKVEEAYLFVRQIAEEGKDILFVGTKEQAQDAVKEAICEKSRQAAADGHRVGIIATDETMEAYRQNSNAASIKSVGSRLDEASVGRSLYRILREFDDENLDILFSESFAESGFGQAIMNRLLKAAGHQVIHV